MINKTKQAGFTAVELLITLIIASMFLFAGYQLYTQVTRDGADANKTAIVSNVAYKKLRKEASDVTTAAPSGCIASAAPTGTERTSTSSENVTGIGTVTYTVTVKCAPSSAGVLDVFRINVKASYKDAGIDKELEHATFVN
ncbi:MAG: prepilin-type N-terminal cleavage/methylation domain-containing protein [Patescibacteria group bacterium]